MPVVSRLPEPVRSLLVKYHEQVKFLIVGGTCFGITTVINYVLKLTVLPDKPVTALTIATVLATVVSYVWNREWSFATRGGRQRRYEATLFFLVSALGVVVNDIPLWISRYVLELQVPVVSQFTQEVADFVSGLIVGTLLAMAFRLWAFRKFVFPHADARPARRERVLAGATAAEDEAV